MCVDSLNPINLCVHYVVLFSDEGEKTMNETLRNFSAAYFFYVAMWPGWSL